MGSLLHETVGPQRCFDELNSTEPEAVFRVHQAYIQAGAQIIETNTFGANRSKLAALGLADKVAVFNHRGVKLAREAREAAPHEVLIAGSIGPLGMGPEIGHLSHEEILEIYREQALALEERGVDLFILETFSNIDILLGAIDALPSFSLLPAVPPNISLSSPGKRRPWAPASSAGAAALRPSTFARSPQRFADCLLPRSR